jgi:hypothetical protein
VLEFREQPRDFTAKDAVLTTRAERDRIMQCVLHYEPDRVWVTDVVHEWTGSAWQTVKGSYAKLRLSGQRIAAQSASLGLELASDGVRNGQRLMVLKRS